MANPAQSKLTPPPQSPQVTWLVVCFLNGLMANWKKKGAILASDNL
jgi:hypothetical protein